MRRSFVVITSILAGGLLIGSLIGRSSIGQSPAAPSITPARYQIQSFAGNRALFIDTATGETWLGTPGYQEWSGKWEPIPTPVNKSK